MKSYTDLEQSKVLAEILPIESADMFYCYGMDIHTKKWNYDIVPTIIDSSNQIDIGDIPCWSLAALLEVTSKAIVMNKVEGNTKYIFSSSRIGIYTTADNAIDAWKSRYRYMKWLIKQYK